MKGLQTLPTLLVVCICVVFVYSFNINTQSCGRSTIPQTYLNSKERVYSKAAVSSDSAVCSKHGSNILKWGGNAIDAAITTMLCAGIIHSQSCGLGGGFFMVYYDRKTGTAHTINARDRAPAAAHYDMFKGNADISKRSNLSIAVPGELLGYWDAHRRFGKLPWSKLFSQAIKLCKDGFEVTSATEKSINIIADLIPNSTLSKTLTNPATGKLFREGDRMTRPSLAETLETISIEGGHSLYNGTLSKLFIEDLQKFGSIITAEDLANYKSNIDGEVNGFPDLINTTIRNGNYRLFTMGPPASGILLGFMYKVLSLYNMTSQTAFAGKTEYVKTLQRIVETFKYAYGQRTWLGDPKYNLDGQKGFGSSCEPQKSILKVMKNLTDSCFARYVHSLIKEESTQNYPSDYSAYYVAKDDHGTSHISVLDPEGNAVSATTSINLYFGSLFRSEQTDIILNNGMDDFSSPNITNFFGLPPSPNNFIQPGRQPMSSMTPSIFIDDKTKDVRLVTGASGGSKITSAVTYQSMLYLWFGNTLKESVDQKQLHHQLYPMEIQYENGFEPCYIHELEKIGHTCTNTSVTAKVNVIGYDGKNVYGYADPRKGGDVDGF